MLTKLGWARAFGVALLLGGSCGLSGQEATSSTATVRGTVMDAGRSRIAKAMVVVENQQTGMIRRGEADEQGRFAAEMLPPGEYRVKVSAERFATMVREDLRLEVGATVELAFTLSIAAARETVTVTGDTPLVETEPSGVSAVVDERAIADLPLNGRRFSDLALLTPGVTQDPRGLTSGSTGDLAFGGVRGYQSSFLVDGADNNNGFFAQARGRYRAPYQFSHEVVKEFRVSSNTAGAELGRSGGAVMNVVTRSGTNHLHGSVFYYLRDGGLSARHPFLSIKPPERQDQFGFTLGGPVRRNKAYFFAGFDQHIFHVPTVVQFLDGQTQLTVTPADYEFNDVDLVTAAAARLSQNGGEFRSRLLGNAGFLKFDVAVTPRHYVSARLSTSRHSGENNVFYDPASPITNFGTSENGEERVSTETGLVSLTSAIGRAANHLRVQFSRDLQASFANSTEPQTKINRVIDGIGRSSILPRRTREHRLQIADTVSLGGRRHAVKLGGDIIQTWTSNYFPQLFGGAYIFDDIRVNPFTFQPQTFGLNITPLRAYAHAVPQFYQQNFGNPTANPDSHEYALFAQDTIRVTDHFAVSLGLRYDAQVFRDGLTENALWPGSGKVPHDYDNLSPRLGFAYSFGENRPVVLRGGYGRFYTRIPGIFTSAVENNNGLARAHLFLNDAIFADQLVFPTYPNALVSCAANATCAAPASVAGKLTTEISTFGANFRTPSVEQASLSAEKELGKKFAVGVAYLYVHGEHLIRSRDVNLPAPATVSYPIFDESGGTFLEQYYDVASFSTWQMSKSLTCAFPPCINPLQRPIAKVGAINAFESAATSLYNGLTVSAHRRFSSGFYLRVAYTWANASDDGQDALVAGRPALVQNSADAGAERGRSVTDQRQRLAIAWSAEPKLFHRDHPALKMVFNNWRFSGVTTAGSGRPINPKVIGDANRDGNTENDRLPGVSRNAFNGPDYLTTDLRLTRFLKLRERYTLEATVEAFNSTNRANKRVDVNDDGFLSAAGEFVALDKTVAGRHYPAYYRKAASFLKPNNAYAPRQVQVSMRLKF